MSDSTTSEFSFDPALHPRKLNLGCGFDLREGYLNVDFQDFHGPDLVGDVRDLPMLPSGGFDEILAIDVLEHLPRADTRSALTEWARLLRVGGVLKLQVPDVTACGRFLVEHDDQAEHVQLIGQLFGTQGYTGDYHLAGFTDLTLMGVLHDAGFHRTELESRDNWMLVSSSQKGGAPLDVVSLGWLRGFWELESSGSGTWRWSDRVGELLLFNHAESREPCRLSWGIGRSAGETAELTIAIHGTEPSAAERISVPAVDEVPWSRTVDLDPGPTRVVLSTEAKCLDVPDPRRLAFRITNPVVQVIAS